MAHSHQKRLEAARRISLGQPVADVARETGIARSLLHRWQQQDPEFRKLVESFTLKVSPAEQAQEVGVVEDIRAVLLEHYKLHRVFRGWAVKILQNLQDLEGSNLSLKSLNLLSQIVCRHVEGERQAIGADFYSLDVAIAEVTKAGYIVSEPDAEDSSEAEPD